MKDNKIQFFGGRGAIDEGVAFQKSTQRFANPYCYSGLNKSIAWRDDERGGFPEKECQKACPEQWLDVQHNDHPPPLQNYSLHVADMPTCHGSKYGIGGQLA